jgi:RHS repeat-associated protein
MIPRKSISTLLILLLLFTMSTPAVPALAASVLPSSSLPQLRPTPVSPPPAEDKKPDKDKKPKEIIEKRSQYAKKFQYPQGLFLQRYFPRPIHQRSRDGGWEDIVDRPSSEIDSSLSTPFQPLSGSSSELSLCLYAGGSSFNQIGTRFDNVMTLNHYTQGGQTIQHDTYLRFPQLRDLIPETATLNSVHLVVTSSDPYTTPFQVNAHAITQAWNPITVAGGSLPSYNAVPAAQNSWTLTPGSARAVRSLNITTLASSWMDGSVNDYGLFLTIPTPAQQINGVAGMDLPVLIVKYTVVGAAADPAFGGSYYFDNITPPVLIPGRVILVDRMGDVDNPISSYTITNYSMDQMIPFRENTLAVSMSFDEVLPGNSTTAPLIQPFPVSNTLFSDYTFPPLNGSALTNEDIYPNYALTAPDPYSDPENPGLIPSPPYLSESIPFLRLDSTDRHHQVDITALVNTPINADLYPYYPLEQFTSVFQIDSNLVDPAAPIQMPLSSLPVVETVSAPVTVEKGELQVAQPSLSFELPIRAGDMEVIVSPISGKFEIRAKPQYKLNLGFNGCAQIIDIWVFPEDSGQSPPDQYVPPPVDRLLPPGNPDPSNPLPLGFGIVHKSPAGALSAFLPVTDPEATSYTRYYNPKVTNMELRVHEQQAASHRYELTTPTGDLSRWFNESGQLTEVTSSIGAQISFTYDTTNPELLTSIEEIKTGFTVEYIYDQYDRLVERVDSDNLQFQYQYDQNSLLQHVTDGQNRQFTLNRDQEQRMTSLSMTSPTRSTPLTLISFGYDTPFPADQTFSNPPADLRLTSVTDACGKASYFSYNDSLRQTVFTDATGRSTTYGFYHEGTLEYIENEEEERKTFCPDSKHASPATSKELACPMDPNEEPDSNTYEYDEYRRLVKATNTEGEFMEWEYNSNNKAISVTDREGKVTHISYTPDGSQVATILLASGQSVEYVYNQNQKIASKNFSWGENDTASYTYTHDANGFVSSITDPLQRVMQYSYSTTGVLQQVTDPLGRVTAYSYNLDGKITNLTYSHQQASKQVTFAYNDLGQLTSVTDPKGGSTSYTYDACGRLSSMTDALQNTTTYEHNEIGLLLSITDPLDRLTSYTYNDQHQLIAVTDPAMKSTQYSYDALGRLISVIDPLDNETTYEYDKLHRIISVTDPLDNTSSFTYSPEGSLLTTTDPLNRTTTFTYDEAYRLSTVTNPLNETTTYTYHLFGGIQSISNALDQSVYYEYDKGGRLLKFTDIQDRDTLFDYDDADRLIETTDAAQRSTTHVYDSFNNLLESTNALNQTTEYTYDLNGNPTSVTTPLGRTYTATYDALNRLISATDPLNHTRSYTYDEVSNPATFTDPLDHITSWEYEVRNLLEKSTDALEQSTENVYDDARRLVSFQDELSRSSSFSYDALVRLTQAVSPGTLSTSYQYDALGNMTQMTRSATAGNQPTSVSITQYSYDVLSRPSTVIDPLLNETSFTYNALSQLTEIALPDNESIVNTYDSYNRLSSSLASDLHSLSYTYDTLDRVTQITDSITGSFSYQYDALDRVTQLTAPDQRVTSFTYDADGRLTQSTYNSDSTSLTYDLASRSTQTTAPGNRIYQRSYDAADRLLAEALPSGINTHLLYDEIHRPTEMSYVLPGGSRYIPAKNSEQHSRTQQPLLLEFKHLSMARFIKLMLDYTLQEGTLSQITQQYGRGSDEAWKYRVQMNNRLRQAMLTDITVASFSPTYNAVSRITEEEDRIGNNVYAYEYTYDDDDQLLTAITPSATYTYSYDERNNRSTQRIQTQQSDTTEYYTYNVADQMLSMTRKDTQTQQILQQMSYSYDDQGRRIQQVEVSANPQLVTEYAYYVGGNLKLVTLPDESTIEFRYDALGNRIRKISEDVIVTYHYNGSNLEEEIHRDATTEAVLFSLRYFPWGFTKTVGQTSTDYYYIVDQRGNTRAITDDEGTLLEEYHYSPYGVLLSTPTISQYRFLSGGYACLWDAEISLYYMHARYYDAPTGRFLTRDAVPGSLTSPVSQNRYTYCQNDPIALIDPTGLSPENTGSPARSSVPLPQYSDFIDDDPCRVPDLSMGGPLGSVRNNYDSCSIDPLYRDQFGNISRKITLPSGATIKLELGKMNADGSISWYTDVSQITDQLDFLINNPGVSPENREYLRGIRDAVIAIANGTQGRGLPLGEKLALAIEQANLIVAELWSEYNKENDDPDKHYQFMRHAIVGGYIAHFMGNYYINTEAYYLAEDESKINRLIGFAISYVSYNEFNFGNLNIDNGFANPGQMDLLGLANLMKAIVAAEWIGRREKGIGIVTDPNNLANVNSEWKTDHMTGRWKKLDFAKIKKSRLLSIMAGVSEIYWKAIVTMSCHPHLPFNSTNFWLETVRYYNYDQSIQGSIDTNDANYDWMKSVLKHVKMGDRRQLSQYIRYEDWLDDLFEGNLKPLP